MHNYVCVLLMKNRQQKVMCYGVYEAVIFIMQTTITNKQCRKPLHEKLYPNYPG